MFIEIIYINNNINNKSYYKRIDVSKCVNVSKTNAWKESIICYCWYLLGKRFRFQPTVYNACRDLLMMSIGTYSIAILYIHGVDFHCIITGITKSDVIKLLKKIDLSEKKDHYKM